MSSAEPPVEPPGRAETTNPLPAVPAEPPAGPVAPLPASDGLPLLDMLAPEQVGPPTPELGFAMPVAVAGPPNPAVTPNVTGPGPMGAQPPVGPTPTLVQPAVPPVPPRPVGPPGAPGMSGVPGMAPRPGGPGMPPQLPPGRVTGPRGWPLVAAIVGGVLLVGLFGWLALRPSAEPSDGQAKPGETATTSAVRTAGGYEFTEHAARTDTDCVGNSYGQVVEFFRQHPCTELNRKLFLTAVEGQSVVVSVAAVRLADEATAKQLQAMVDTSGTGNVADLLRAGVRVPGGPDQLTNAGYASQVDGATVVIVESSYTDPALTRDGPLDQICQAAVQLAG